MCRHSSLCGSPDCADTVRRSLASYPGIEKYWIPELNDNMNILTVGRMSNKLRWMRCKICNHIYHTTPNNFCHKKGCGYCQGKTLCDGDCDQCFNSSLASFPNIERYWSPRNGDLTPRNLFKNSNKYVYFNCKKCGHEYNTMIDKFVTLRGCRYCSEFGSSSLCENDTCDLCYKRSFASNPMSKYLIDPTIARKRRLFSEEEECEFRCPDCNNLYRSHMSYVSSGTWCGCKKRKTETKVLTWIEETFPNHVIRPQYALPGMSKHHFDISILDISLHIEIDGIQHFEQVSNWRCAEITQVKDVVKMLHAHHVGHRVIRISQVDIWNDAIDWRAAITSAMKDSSPIAYIACNENLYDSHKRLCECALFMYDDLQSSSSRLGKIVSMLGLDSDRDGVRIAMTDANIGWICNVCSLYEIKNDDVFDAFLHLLSNVFHIFTEMQVQDDVAIYRFHKPFSLLHGIINIVKNI